MKQNSFQKSGCKFTFIYNNSPSKRELQHEIPSVSSIANSSGTERHRDQIMPKNQNTLFSGGKSPAIVNTAHNTIRKECLEVEATTLRKQFRKKDGLDVGELGDVGTQEHQCQQENVRTNENNLLREEIKYMRKMLIESQNTKKQLKLQFQLFKASSQAPQQSQVSIEGLQDVQVLKDQMQRLTEELNKSQSQNKRLIQTIQNDKQGIVKIEQKLKEQEKQCRVWEKRVDDMTTENKQKQQYFSGVQKQVGTLRRNYEEMNEQIMFLRNCLYERDSYVQRCGSDMLVFREQFENSQQTTQAMESQILRLQNTIKMIKLNTESALSKLQSNDTTLNEFQSKCQQLDALKRKLQQINHQEDADRLVVKAQQQNYLYNVKTQNDQLHIALQRMQENQRIIVNQVEWLRAQNRRLEDNFTQSLGDLEQRYNSDLSKIHKENQSKAEELENRIQKLTVQLEQSYRGNEELTEKYQSVLVEQYEEQQSKEQLRKKQEKKSVKTSIKPQQKKQINEVNNEQTLLSKQQSEVTESDHLIQAKSLSKQQLKEHLKLLKNQSDELLGDNEQLMQNLKQQIQFLKCELQLTKAKSNESLQRMRDRYQRQMHLNNEEYSHQLSIYMKQIQILVQQMDKIKGTKQRYCEQIIQQDEQQDQQCDDDKIKRDLIMHSDDSSQLYRSPNITPIKSKYNQTEGEIESNSGSNEYMLQDIIDLDSKISSYIQNYNGRNGGDGITKWEQTEI